MINLTYREALEKMNRLCGLSNRVDLRLIYASFTYENRHTFWRIPPALPSYSHVTLVMKWTVNNAPTRRGLILQPPLWLCWHLTDIQIFKSTQQFGHLSPCSGEKHDKLYVFIISNQATAVRNKAEWRAKTALCSSVSLRVAPEVPETTYTRIWKRQCHILCMWFKKSMLMSF